MLAPLQNMPTAKEKASQGVTIDYERIKMLHIQANKLKRGSHAVWKAKHSGGAKGENDQAFCTDASTQGSINTLQRNLQ